MAQQDKERFNRALRAMKPLGLATNAVNSTLKRLLKIYENEWELIEAESYRVLADAVFEYEEDLEKRKQARKQQRQAELEDEAERENVPRLTRARSQALALAYSQKRAEASGVSFEPATSSRQAQSRARESQGTAGGFKRPKVESPEREMSVFNGNSVLPPPPPLPPRSLQRQGDGAEEKSICGLKRPKIEPNLDLPEPAACAGGFSTPVVEEKECEDRGLAGGLKKPKMELAVACASVDSVPLAVMDVLPIAAVNILSSPADTTGARSNPAVVEVQARADLSRFERIHEYHGGQDCSTQHSNSLGAIAEAYMEMDKEEDSAFELSLAEPEASLGALDSGLCNAQLCLDYNNGLQESALGQPRLEYNNGLQGLSHEQPCLEYNKSLQGLGHGQPYLQYSNGIQGSGHARCCTGYESSLKGLQHVQPNLDNNGGLKESNVPQPSLEMVLKRAEDYTLRSFKILFPNFPIMKMMEAFCLHFLKSRNSGIYGEARTETVSVSNLLTSNDQGKVRRSSRISQRTQELPRPDKGKASSETKACVSKSKMLISLERSQQNVEESRPVHDLSDISRGEESIPLPVVNEVTSESSPPPFHYIQKSIVYQNAYVNFSLARVGDDDCCSNCFGNCLESPITCACARETGGEYAYTIDGLLKKEFLHEALSLQLNPQKHQLFYCKDCPIERSKNDHKPDPCKGHAIRKFIKECWSKCGCNKRCGNRVVQRGICRKLQVFFTPEGKGWGVRTLEGIPEGAFVCEYVGEILTNTELYIRNTERTGKEKHTYPVLLDADWCSEGVLKDEEALCLDATHYGNVARFINHRCFDANLTEFPVEVESPDRHYYHLAFFTTRKVEAQEELTWVINIIEKSTIGCYFNLGEGIVSWCNKKQTTISLSTAEAEYQGAVNLI